jgi:hypothetical protein
VFTPLIIKVQYITWPLPIITKASPVPHINHLILHLLIMSTITMFSNLTGIRHPSLLTITPEQGEKITQDLRANTSARYPPSTVITEPPTNITLWTVSTYVREPKPGNVQYARIAPLVPEFASHWGIVVQKTDPSDPKNKDVWLFHLCLVEDEEKRRSITLVVDGLVKDDKQLKGKKVAEVGRTRFSIDQITRIGREMIEAFGDYHLIFWNCQMFAKCFLKVISDDNEATFDSWTSADITNLFLCSFIISAPLTTSLKNSEVRKMKELRRIGMLKADMYKEAQEPDPENRDELNRYSDSAIDLIKLVSLSNHDVMKSMNVDIYTVKDSEDKMSVIKGVMGLFSRLFGS